MPPRLRGKWALGITPRNFTWIMKDKLAVCERPGGYGDNHRRVRRQEEIIWLRENGFGCLISIIPAPHNLHNYDELGAAVPPSAVHRGRRPRPVAAATSTSSSAPCSRAAPRSSSTTRPSTTA